MKKFLLLAVMAVFAFSETCFSQAVIKFEKETINLGTFAEEKPQTCVFVFTNMGDKPLVVNQAFASCGCTVAKHTESPVAPGEKGQITVTYDGKGKMAGPFRKTITVRSNATNGLVRVYIEGTMQATPKK